MKHFYFFTILLMITVKSLSAQDWLGFHSSNYAGVQGISYQPASIVDSRYKFQVNLIGFSSYIANNYYKIPHEDYSSFDIDYDRLIESDKESDKAGMMSVELYAPLSFMLTLNPKSAMGLTLRSRSMINFDGLSERSADFVNEIIDKEEFVIEDGDYFDLSNIYLQSHQWNELGLTYGRVVLDEDKHFLKAAGTVKLLDGVSSAYSYFSKLKYEGQANDYVDLIDVDVQTGFSDNITYNDSDVEFEYNPFENLGLGLDLGVVYEFRPNIEDYHYSMDGKDGLLRRDKNKYKFRAGFSILDLGSIKYKKSNDSGNVSGSTENLDVNNLDGDVDEVIEDILTLQRGGDYTMNLPTRLVGDFDYNVKGGFYVNATTQIGLKAGGGDMEKTRYVSTVSLTPRWEGKHFEFGLPVSYDKLANLNTGFSFRLACLVLGSRDAVSNFLLGKDPNSTNVYVGIRFGLPYKKKKDKDNDGVSNKYDVCPKVPGVWAFKGCPDTDEDGIQDSQDSCVTVPGVEALNGCPDADGDGIKDSEDACPEVAGIKKFNGCPDSDGDGIKDSEDACPDEPGSVEMKGCPDRDGDGVKDSEDACPDLAGPVAKGGCPDSDGDGIYDSDDKCPKLAGPAENSGCPYADTDGDGVVDKEDECVLIPGVPENHGCPEIKEEEQEILNTAFKNLEFESGSDKIALSSYSSLVELANLLKKKPEWKLKIEGHTDNVGNPASNLKLSKKRAQAVADFLTAQEIESERLIVDGFGDKLPVADNSTAEGRKANRRVEMTVLFE